MSLKDFKFYLSLMRADKYTTIGDFIAFVKSYNEFYKKDMRCAMKQS